jgi:demethylmenaquinone methyltransferase/2-methoxy-6-polyprenyl-1,4-benzoquinol methylase
MTLFDHFGTIAPIYDRFFRAHNPARLAELVNLPAPGFLLDVGGGTGRVAQSLKPWHQSIIVADLSFRMLQNAGRKDGLYTVCAPAERLPFADESFERIIMVDALHHVCSQAKAVQEMWRLLRPGGRIVIEEPDIRCMAVVILALVEKILLMRSRFLSPPKIVALFPPTRLKQQIVVEGYTAWIIIEK